MCQSFPATSPASATSYATILLVLLLGDDTFKDASSFALWEVVHVVILGRCLDEPAEQHKGSLYLKVTNYQYIYYLTYCLANSPNKLKRFGVFNSSIVSVIDYFIYIEHWLPLV